MKKILLLLLLTVACATFPARASFVINGRTYSADTMMRRQVGPGMINTIVRIPGIPLNIYVIEVDLNDPNNRVETTYGLSKLGSTEKLSSAMARHRTPTKRPIAACNANFWVVHGSYLANFEMGSPLGGVVCNDTTVVNDNNTYDTWSGGPQNNGTAAITHDKTIVMGRVKWSGFINSEKFAQPLEYQNVNRRAVTGEICLYGPPFSRTRAFENNWVNTTTKGTNNSDNYYLTFVEGSQWAVNAPMTLRVDSIVTGKDRRTLGRFDACLTVTGDANKAIMSALEVGDVIQLNSGWMPLDADASVIPTTQIENLVCGNATIMHNGELTSRNEEDGYNVSDYSRTCYGTSADGKHFYMLVIDKSASKTYGNSLGCNTATACEILRQMCPDVSEMVNMDAGGSAEMLVNGKVINTTTEGTPRGVACGWMVEAVGEEDYELASIAFDQFRLDVPEFATATPRILGYNKIGELIDEDVKGFTLTCTESVGTAEGETFVATDVEAWGSITATLNGMSATVPVHVMPASPYILLTPRVIDERDYAIEVASKLGNKVYFYDTSGIDWTVNDTTIAKVTDGLLRGIQNGRTKISCNMGPYNLSGNVRVEISDEPYRYEPWSDWAVSGAGAKNLVLDEETGHLTFNYVTNRAPNIKLTKDLYLFGLPDSIGFVFNSTMPIDYVQIDTRNYFFTKTNYVKFMPEDDAPYFEPGVDHVLAFNLKELGGADYVGTYPINIKTIKFTLTKTAAEDDYVLDLKALYCHYPNFGEEPPVVIHGDVNGDGEVNIADINVIIDAILTGSTSSENADVNGDGEINIADINSIIDLILK